MHNNKWNHGRTELHYSGAFPWSNLAGFSSGVMPMPIVLDPAVGEEIGLFIIDYTSFAHEIASLKPFQLYINSGLVRCQAGPILFFLYWLPKPRLSWLRRPLSRSRHEPFASFEYIVNPHDSSTMGLFRGLADQTHWHVFVIGPDDEELNWFEFPNNFDLGSTLASVDKAVSSLPMTDYEAAKAEFQSMFTLDELSTLEN